MTKTKVFLLLFFVIAALFLAAAVAVWYFFLSPTVEKTETNTNQPTNRVANIPSTPEKKFERDAKLQREADALLPLFDKMPSVAVYLKDEPVLKGGTNVENGVAYNVCENKTNPMIFVKQAFYQKANSKQLVNILKHELTHAWFCRQGIQAGHDARFREKFKQVGGFGN